jgi:hypothetical protein
MPLTLAPRRRGGEGMLVACLVPTELARKEIVLAKVLLLVAEAV